MRFIGNVIEKLQRHPKRIVFPEGAEPRHFTDAGCVLMFGGGVKRGYLHGVTADERPCKTLEKRVIIEDLHASIFRAVGISPRLSYETEKRPFYVTRDGLGKPIMDLFS